MNFPKNLQYSVEARWDHATGGTAEASGYSISYDTPSEYDGNGGAPCPDQLFLASIAGCLMNTFLSFKNRLGAEITDINVHVDAEIKLEDHGYRVKQIDAEITVTSSEDMAEINRRCGELARDYCHITRSIEKAIPMNVKVTVREE